jgi:flavin-dependent dehydrogenase
MQSPKPEPTSIIIIGAGPAGCVAAALLKKRGHEVTIVERQRFPRFSIGESLLPQCMEFLEEAELLSGIQNCAQDNHFQYKNGAAFYRNGDYSDFDFRQKVSDGWGTTFQVQRASFDHQLANNVEQLGVPILWEHEVTNFDNSQNELSLTLLDPNKNPLTLNPKFVLDASGFGRVLPRLLQLDKPSDFPSRTSLFTHIEDNINCDSFDRDKIRITVHHQYKDVWYWLIPFANGRSSIGVVAENSFFENRDDNLDVRLQALINDEPSLKQLFQHSKFDTPARQTTGYSCDVNQLWGPGFALLGNAGEFLDPVFSSGVTIAMKSASLAAAALDKQLNNIDVDWDDEYSTPLRAGVDTFRAFVEAWYDGRFQDIIFAKKQSPEVRAMISSILAGYAWDNKNPYVKDSARRINTLAELCKTQ